LRTPFIHSRSARRLLLTVAALFFLLRFVHLTADYPRNIRWDDGIATDEGWYASAAVDQATWGTPLLPGDMNIPVLMPVWSIIANAAFHIGGFHVTSLRATAILFFAACLVLSCILLRRYGARDWIPLFAALLCVNPWSFAFSRAAFLEFPMLAFCLLAACLCPPRELEPNRNPALRTRRQARLFAAGLCFGAAILLKTTAAVLAPVLLYLILQAESFKLRHTIRAAAILFTATALVYLPYWWLVIVPHQADVAFYLSVVKSTLRFTPYGFVADASRPFRYGLGSDHLLFALSLIVIPLSLISSRLRTLWRDPIFSLAAVWMIIFLGFMVKHNNDPARYFAITLPAVLMIATALLRHTTQAQPHLHQLLLALIALDLAINAAQISTSLLHPTYTYRNAALAIANIVRNEPAQSQVVIGDEMHEISLQNGLKPVNLLFHADTITQQMDRYNPGWWLQFSPIEDGRCFREVLSLAYTAEHRGEWTIFYPGQQLILWKLTKIPEATLPQTLSPAQTAACTPPSYN
jgi:4-amino-4-deoxy-L-arabinose transferase-like glycosyltransferase